jgi:glycosyltransferase involved in cell wall biosynthesis
MIKCLKKVIKVMRICLDLRHKTESGGSTYVKQLTENLLRLDRENQYVLLKYRSQSFGFEHLASEVLLGPRLPNALELLWTICVLPSMLAQRRIDVHHGMKSPVPFFSKVPTVTTMHSTHDNYRGEYYTRLPMRLYFTLYGNRLFPRVKAVIAVSHFLKECLVEHHGVSPEKIYVIHHGIGESFRPMTHDEIAPVLERYGLRREYILCVGNVTVVKNQITVIKALNEIAQQTQADLVIAGATKHRNSQYTDVAATANRLGLRDRVRFLGFVGSNDLAALLNGARVLAFPSLHEGCPITMLEAFKCGVPIIASPVEPVAELGRGRVLLMQDPRDHRELARLLARVLSSESLQQELRAKSLAAAEEYSWERSARTHMEVYRRCCSDSKALKRSWSQSETRRPIHLSDH